MGDLKAASRFEVDTKIVGFKPGTLTKDAILASAKQSLADLGVDKVGFVTEHRLSLDVLSSKEH